MINYKELIKNWTRGFWQKELEDLDHLKGMDVIAEVKTTENSRLKTENKNLIDANNKLIKQYAYIPVDVQELGFDIKTKYPKAKVVYKGYNIRLKNGAIKPDIRVEDFIQVMNSHVIWCKINGFTLKKYLQDYSDMPFGDIVNKLMYDIFKKYIPRKRYMYDKDLYGEEEHWAPTLETWYLKKMDCENNSNELMALFEAAGLGGVLRSFYWNVVGMAYGGFGHSTVYAYDFKNDVWRILEATQTSTSAQSFYKLPEYHDVKELSNIKNVWWSCNSERARHTFKNPEDKKTFADREKFTDITIKKEA